MLSTVVLLAGLTTALCACSSGQKEPEQKAQSADRTQQVGEHSVSGTPWKEGDKVPDFTGPWKSVLTRVYKTTQNDMQRAILKDGRVTEQEYVQLQDAFGKCVAAKGFTEYEYDGDDHYSYRPPKGWSDEKIGKADEECVTATRGEVMGLYFTMRKNPQNEDRMELMASCLVKSKLAPKGYTGADYKRDFDRDTFPFDTKDDRIKQCQRDPKNILSGK